MDSKPGSVVVAGGGAFGTAAALELRRRGHEVVLVDRTNGPHPDASSTDISKVVRMDYGDDVFYHELAEASLDGWDRWNAEWSRPLYHEHGFLVLCPRPLAPGGFEYESARVLRERGYPTPPLTPEILARDHPAWNAARYPDGYVSRRGGWAESGAVVQELAKRCAEAGVRFVAGRAVGLLERGSRVAGVRYEAAGGGAERLEADRVVVAAGAWTPFLLPWLADVMTCVAQPVVHVRVDPVPEWQPPLFPPFAADISGSGWYGFPALDDGRLKLGHHGDGRAVHPDDRGEVGPDHLERVRSFFDESLPGLVDAPVAGTRVCLYCDTFDGDLWIGEDPGREGLVVAAGGSGHGFKFAPMLGTLVADALERRENRWLKRFRWRPRGERRQEAARLQHGPERGPEDESP